MKAWQIFSEAHNNRGGAAKRRSSQWQCFDLNQSLLLGVLNGAQDLALRWHGGSPTEHLPRRPTNPMRDGDVSRTALIHRGRATTATHCLGLLIVGQILCAVIQKAIKATCMAKASRLCGDGEGSKQPGPASEGEQRPLLASRKANQKPSQCCLGDLLRLCILRRYYREAKVRQAAHRLRHKTQASYLSKSEDFAYIGPQSRHGTVAVVAKTRPVFRAMPTKI